MRCVLARKKGSQQCCASIVLCILGLGGRPMSFWCAHARSFVSGARLIMAMNVKDVPGRLRFDLESLRRYLAAELPGFECTQGTLRARQFAYGQSNPTYHLATSGGQEYALRRRPPGKLLPGAHRVSQPTGRGRPNLCRN